MRQNQEKPVPFEKVASVPTANTFISRQRDRTVLGGVYVKGKKVAADFLENMRIVFDEHLPRWNYRAVPANG